jgi:hypothetical protein
MHKSLLEKDIECASLAVTLARGIFKKAKILASLKGKCA